MSIDLATAVASWVENLGVEEVKRLLKEKLDKSYSDTTVTGWKTKKTSPTLAVIQIVLDGIKVDFKEEASPFPESTIYFIQPTYREVNFWNNRFQNILRYKYQRQLGFLSMLGSDITLTRNKLADRFLKETKAEWAFWLDSDMVPPTGYPAESKGCGAKFDPELMAFDAVARLMSHGKTFVSALYYDRYGKGSPMFAEGRNNETVASQVRRGPVDELRQTDWTGAGCCLVHRSVYEDMLEKIPAIKSDDHHPNRFYDKFEKAGEDASFALRAKEIGHQPHVDLGCLCGHSGEVVHFNEKIR